MNILEKDLEEIIFTTDNEKLRDRGLSILGKKYRQLRIGNYGVADIVTVVREGRILHITVYELKKDKAGISAFLQCLRYAKGIREYVNYRNFSGFVEIRMVLIGREIDTVSDYIFLDDFMENIINYSYSYNFEGISFNYESGYKLTESGFKNKLS